MSVTFTAAELRSIQEASLRLLGILDHADLSHWAAEVAAVVKPLVGADRIAICAPAEDGVRLLPGDPDMLRAVEVYADHFADQDFVITEKRRRSGLRAYTMDLLARPEEYEHTSIWNDWALANRLCDPSGLGFDLEPYDFPFVLHVYHERSMPEGFGAKELAIFKLLFPAYRAAVLAGQRVHGHDSGVLRQLDRLSVPFLLLAADGRVVRRSAEFERQVVDPTLERRITAAAAELTRRLASRSRSAAIEDAPTGPVRARVDGGPRGVFQLDAALVESPTAAAAPHVLVHLTLPRRRLPPPARVRARLGLTRREAEVALLIARRLSNREIADELGISPHTARRHTERIFAKLGVSRREDAARVVVGVD